MSFPKGVKQIKTFTGDKTSTKRWRAFQRKQETKINKRDFVEKHTSATWLELQSTLTTQASQILLLLHIQILLIILRSGSLFLFLDSNVSRGNGGSVASSITLELLPPDNKEIAFRFRFSSRSVVSLKDSFQLNFNFQRKLLSEAKI